MFISIKRQQFHNFLAAARGLRYNGRRVKFSSTILPPANSAPPEKRRNLRVPLRVLRVETALRGQVFFGHAVNLSKTGLFVQTTNPKPVGFKAKIRFELPKAGQKIEAMAEVVRNQEFTGQKGVQPGMGLKFVDLSIEAQEIIEKFVDEKTGEKKV